MKRDDEWVCVSEWGERKPSKASFLLWCVCVSICVSVLSCVCTCDQECIYVWEEGILPAVFFPEPLPVSPPHTILKAGVGGFGLGKIQPTRGDGGEEPVFLSLSLSLSSELCLFPPLTECYYKSCSHTLTQTFPHPSIQCVLVYLI